MLCEYHVLLKVDYDWLYAQYLDVSLDFKRNFHRQYLNQRSFPGLGYWGVLRVASLLGIYKHL